jgi:hypothetical protein
MVLLVLRRLRAKVDEWLKVPEFRLAFKMLSMSFHFLRYPYIGLSMASLSFE